MDHEDSPKSSDAIVEDADISNDNLDSEGTEKVRSTKRPIRKRAEKPSKR